MSSSKEVLAEALKEWFADRDERTDPAEFILGRLNAAGWGLYPIEDIEYLEERQE